MAKPKHRKASMTSTNVKRAATVTTGGMAVIAISAASSPAMAAPDSAWDGVIECESGGNPTAQNPTSSASGLYQIIDETWAAYGGLAFAQHAKGATPEQQRIVAEAVLAGQGPGAWVCNDSLLDWANQTLPAPVATPAPEPVQVEPANQITVQPGNTLSEIGAAVGEDWHSIYEANKQIIGDNPDLIYPTQVLMVGGLPLANAPVKVEEEDNVEEVVPAAPTEIVEKEAPAAPQLQEAPVANSAGPLSANARLAVNSVFTNVPGAQLISLGGTRGSAVDPDGHPSGNAIDYMVLGDQGLGDAIVQYNVDNWDSLSVEYIIYRQRIMTSPNGGWEPMENRGSATANHMDHVHVNYNP